MLNGLVTSHDIMHSINTQGDLIYNFDALELPANMITCIAAYNM